MDLQKPNRGLLCVFGLTFAAVSAFGQKTNITGFADNSGGQHVFYLDANQNLNQLFYVAGTSWEAQNLTSTFGGNLPASLAALTSFVDAAPGTGQHVFYIDANGHVNQFYYPGTGTTWIPQDLTGTYGGTPAASTVSSLAGLSNSENGAEYVFYVDSNNHVDLLYYPGSGTTWFWEDLTANFGGTTGSASSSLGAFEDFLGGEHVFYTDSNNHISQIYYPGSGTTWFAQDLTASFGGAPATSTSNLTAYLDAIGGQHVAYVDSNTHLSQLYYPGFGTAWVPQDLTATQGGNAPGSTSKLASYIDNDGLQHIAYIDGSGNVNQMYYPNTGTMWTVQNLTAISAGSPAATSSALVAFPPYFDFNMIGQHILYLDGNDNVNQVYYPFSGGPMWFWQNLSSYGGNAPALRPVFSISTSNDSSQNQ